MNNEAKLNSLRSQLPALAASMDQAIDDSLSQIRKAVRLAEHMQDDRRAGDQWLAWKKGLTDSLLMLRTAEEAHKEFRVWWLAAMNEMGQEGVTEAEREALFGRLPSNSAGSGERASG